MGIRAILTAGFALAFVPTALGAEPVSGQIIRGDRLSGNRFPQLQLLQAPGGWSCSATLIGPRVVLTAGHCCHAEDPEFDFYNVSGARKLLLAHGGGETHPLNVPYRQCSDLNFPHDISHPHDLCLGFLDREVRGLAPVSVSQELPSVGESLWLLGVGRPKLNTRQYAAMNVEAVSDIGATLENQRRGVAGDSGDSGGAVLRVSASGTPQLVGVASTSSRHDGICGIPPFKTGIVLLGSSAARDFMSSFARKHGVKICGINQDCAAVKW